MVQAKRRYHQTDEWDFCFFHFKISHAASIYYQWCTRGESPTIYLFLFVKLYTCSCFHNHCDIRCFMSNLFEKSVNFMPSVSMQKVII